MTCRLNRATGTRTELTIQEETCWGEVAISQNAYGIEYSSESLRNEINTIESQLIRSDRMRSATQHGNHRPGGDINGELQPHGVWPLLLKHALGGLVTTSGSSPYVHSLQGDVELPEGLTVEKAFNFPDNTNNIRRLRYRGGRVNEFGLTIPTEGIITCRAGLLFQQEELSPGSAMDSSPTYPTDNEPFNSYQGALMLDQNADGTRTMIATITSFDMLINNSIDGDQFAIDGAQYRADLPEDIRIINGNFGAFFVYDNWQLYQHYRNNRSLSLELTLTRGSWSWQITLPQIKIGGNPTPQVGGRGPLNLEMSYDAFRDDSLGTDIQVTINNSDPQITTAA